MEHAVAAPVAGMVDELAVAAGDVVVAGQLLLTIAVSAGADRDAEHGDDAVGFDPAAARPDLDALRERKAVLADAARPEAVARRHALGRRTARENLADLCDPDSFEEYGGFVIAAQRARRPHDELVQRTPADGIIAGLARIDGHRCAVLSYDYMVMAGTQGMAGHHKQDRFFALIDRLRLPVVLFAEGGGGRPGDTDHPVVSGNTVKSFALFAGLSGLVPTIGIASGRCFAGNAALLGCCDVVIATPDANIGMGGPAMIEGGGLGSFSPEDIGPVSVQSPNGVIDVLAAGDADAVVAAKAYLGFFRGRTEAWECADQTTLRHLVPVDRKRVYDSARVVATLADTGSTLELRGPFGTGVKTVLARIEGRPVGIVASNPEHLGGAIDADAADKAARFMQLCDAHDLPILFLCDTPGFMVGPDAEESAQVRRFSRLFVTGASVTVPVITIILRKAYGLGALAMAAGGFHSPVLTAAWPTGELGGMNIEGAVQLGARRELDAIDDPTERERVFEERVAQVYERSRAMDGAEIFELDDVIDPADTRRRIVNTLRSCPDPPQRSGKKRPMVDTW